MEAQEGLIGHRYSTTNPRRIHEPEEVEDISISTFVSEQFKDIIGNHACELLYPEHKEIEAEFYQYTLNQKGEPGDKWPENKWPENFETKYGKRLDILEKTIKNAGADATGEVCRKYTGIAMFLTLVKYSETNNPNHVMKLAEVVDVIKVEQIPNALLLELKARNTLGAVFHSRTQYPSSYNMVASANLNRIDDLQNRVKQLSIDDRNSMLQWLGWNEATFYDDSKDSYIQKLRNYYTFYVDRTIYEPQEYANNPIWHEYFLNKKNSGDRKAINFGLLYLKATANQNYSCRCFGIVPGSYMIFVCCCYTVACKCIELGFLLQAEHCLATADAALRTADKYNFVSYTDKRRAHRYAKALVNLGYRNLLLSWASQYFEKDTLHNEVDNIGISGLMDNPLLYKTPCTRAEDVPNYVDESNKRRIEVEKEIPPHKGWLPHHNQIFKDKDKQPPVPFDIKHCDQLLKSVMRHARNRL